MSGFEIRLPNPYMVNGLLITADSIQWMSEIVVNVTDTAAKTKNVLESFLSMRHFELFSGGFSRKPDLPFSRTLEFPSPEVTDR